MTEPAALATVREYSELVDALRRRAHELNISRSQIDILAGLQPGYAAKLLAPVPMRRLGLESLGQLLQGLGLMLIVAVDPDADIFRRRITGLPKRRRTELAAGKHEVVTYQISRRKLGRLARLGGQIRARKLTKRKRVQIARRAGRASWRSRRLR